MMMMMMDTHRKCRALAIAVKKKHKKMFKKTTSTDSNTVLLRYRIIMSDTAIILRR